MTSSFQTIKRKETLGTSPSHKVLFTTTPSSKVWNRHARLGEQRSLAVFIKEIMIAKKGRLGKESGGGKVGWEGWGGEVSCPKLGVMNLSAACT